MTIVSRINKFLNLNGISSSQFADACGIPRPSVSQLLNGRNKKISSEVVGRIHATYPMINISWLMFGEGEMLVDTKNEISEGQIQQTIDFQESQSPINEDIASQHNFIDDITEIASNNLANDINPQPQTQSPLISFISSLKQEQNAPRTRISSNSGFNKNIVNIIVVYDDDTCDLLSPSSLR